MKKLLLLVFGGFALLAQNANSTDSITGSLKARAQLGLERQKLELEEKRLYLASLEKTTLTEAKAYEVSQWILQHLRGYPQGKKAKSVDEDTRLIMETLLSLKAEPVIPH